MDHEHDLLAETPLSLTELAKKENVNTSTSWRWATRGLAGEVLETLFVPGRGRSTTVEAWRRFVDRVNAAKSGHAVSVTANRAKQIAAAEKELQRLGV